ncbi:hypothetical protein NYE24_10505 [Paenibacillus sp. FSL H7-0350]
MVRLIKLCMQGEVQNEAYDVYSLKPAAKFEILDYFAEYPRPVTGIWPEN